jgi:hypothetical protein
VNDFAVNDFALFMIVSTARGKAHGKSRHVYSTRLEDMVRDISIQHGCQRNLRIETLPP